MYPFDAPFRDKMFFVGIVAGVSFLISEFLDVIPQAKKDFRAWKKNYFENEYPKVKAESDRIVHKMKQKIFRKVMSVLVISIFVMSGLFIFTGTTGATRTGNSYSGSGDWTITQATIYTNEIVNVFGNINITSGSLTLVNTILTMNQPSAFARTILVSGGYLSIQSGSTIQSTNYTAGKWNTNLRINNGVDYLYMDNSTAKNIFFDIVYAFSHINNCTLYSCGIWNQYAFDYDIGVPCGNTLILYNDIFRDTTTVGQSQHDLIMTGSNFKLNYCQFTNITLISPASDYNSMIHGSYQNNMTITHNIFASATYPLFFFRGDDSNSIDDLDFSYNTMYGIGGINYTYSTYGGEFKGTSHRTIIANNHYYTVRNGSCGIYIDGVNWILNDNRFDMIDSTGLTTDGTTRGIWVQNLGNCVLIHRTIFNNILGGLIDEHPSIGICSIQAGNFTICHSIMRNISAFAGGISRVDNVAHQGVSVGNIIIFANYMDNIYNVATGMYIEGNGGATITWNNITHVNGKSTGIQMHNTNQPVLLENNSITLPTYGQENTEPFHQISIGAFSVCQSDQWNITFRNNHVTGGTIDWPSYDISGEKAIGGYWTHVSASIDVSESTIIRMNGANLTIRHNTQLLRLIIDEVPAMMKFYHDGTSFAYYNNSGFGYSYVNISASNVYLSVNPTEQHIHANFERDVDGVLNFSMDASGSAIATIVIYGLTDGHIYYVYVDGVSTYRLTANNGRITFEYFNAWSEHEFGIVPANAFAENPTYNALMVILAIIAIAGVSLMFISYKKEYSIMGMTLLLVAILIACVILPIAIITIWG
jgi:hypothetical protein